MKYVGALALTLALVACKKEEAKPGEEFIEPNRAYCLHLAERVKAKLVDKERSPPLRSGFAVCRFRDTDLFEVRVDCKDEAGSLYRAAAVVPNSSELKGIGKEAYKGMVDNMTYGINTGSCSLEVRAEPGQIATIEAADYTFLRMLAGHIERPENQPNW